MEDSELELHSSKAERLKDRLRISVISIVEAEAQNKQMVVSRPVMTAVADLTIKFAEQIARDLEMFAQHANRKSINMDDVFLVARRNDDVVASLRLVAEGLSKGKEPKQERKRKKKIEEANLKEE